MKTILEKYRKSILDQAYEKHKGAIIPWVSQDNMIKLDDGAIKFLDIDYSSDDRARWAPYTHLARIEELLLSNFQDVKPICLGLLKYWVDNDFICPNWWYNEIGVPMLLADIVVILDTSLDADLRDSLIVRLSRGIITPETKRTRGVYTGANLLWFCSNTMLYALLTENDALLEYITEVAAKETNEAKEGLQCDDSFFQHGPRLYSAGYGRSFVMTIIPMIHLLDGTKYSFPKYALDNLARIILGGLRYMMHCGYYDYVAVGREYVRPNNHSARSLLRSCDILSSVSDFDRKDEIIALAKSITDAKPSFNGVKYFSKAKLLTMSINGVYISYKGIDPDILDAEIINDENRLGYNLSYGTHSTVMQNGEEYYNIAPVWDYSKIPGTTAPGMSDTELLNVADFSKRFIETSDYGGWCEDEFGAIYLTTVHEGISVTACAFATPYGMIVLGNSIKDEKGRTLFTTVEQCRAIHKVIKIDGGVVHGKVKYLSLDNNAPISFTVEKKIGNWNRNRPSEPDCVAEESILTVSVDSSHGYDKYAYIIAPEGIDLCGIEVVVNDGLDQQIRLPDGRILNARNNIKDTL